MASVRITREYNHRARNPHNHPLVEDILPQQSDPLQWIVTMKGCCRTPFEGGTYRIQIQFPAAYPSAKPKLKCMTPMFATLQECNECMPWGTRYFLVLVLLERVWENCCRRPQSSLHALFSRNAALFVATASTMNSMFACGQHFEYPPMSRSCYNSLCGVIPYYLISCRCMNLKSSHAQPSVTNDIARLVISFFGSADTHCGGITHFSLNHQEMRELWSRKQRHNGCRNELRKDIAALMKLWLNNESIAMTSNEDAHVSSSESGGFGEIKIRIKMQMVGDSGFGTEIVADSSMTALDLKREIVKRMGVAHLASFQFKDKRDNQDLICDIPERKYDYHYRDSNERFLVFYHVLPCACKTQVVECTIGCH